jgi:hypothetical protein
LWHTIPIVVANTSTINKTETTMRQIRVGAGIASNPIKKLLLHQECFRSRPHRCFIDKFTHARQALIFVETGQG